MKSVQGHSGAVIVAVMVAAASPISRAVEEQVPDGGALEEVVVTAQRRAEHPLDVAGSISVISAADIDRLHVTSLDDLAAAVPGLLVSNGGSVGQDSIVL